MIQITTVKTGLRGLLAILLVATVSGCYYPQLIGGQMKLLWARQPIAQLIADPDTDATLKTRLAQVLAARRWAVTALALPDNDSYTSYVALDRPYVLWNVFATPALSLAPLEHCFVWVGCLAYRGYYDEARARAQAEVLAAQGFDTYVGGVPAYSTLGWFDDPVISSMLHWDQATLIGTVFHELAHQRVFAKGDSVFNESYARFVEQQGVRVYWAAHPELAPPDPLAETRQREFVAFILAARTRLETGYAQPLDEAQLREQKRATFAQLQADYRALRDGAWRGDARYDAWFAALGENNARLLPFGLYDEKVPAFTSLFMHCGEDWPRFHTAVAALAQLDAAARSSALSALTSSASSPRRDGLCVINP